MHVYQRSLGGTHDNVTSENVRSPKNGTKYEVLQLYPSDILAPPASTSNPDLPPESEVGVGKKSNHEQNARKRSSCRLQRHQSERAYCIILVTRTPCTGTHVVRQTYVSRRQTLPIIAGCMACTYTSMCEYIKLPVYLVAVVAQSRGQTGCSLSPRKYMWLGCKVSTSEVPCLCQPWDRCWVPCGCSLGSELQFREFRRQRLRSTYVLGPRTTLDHNIIPV